MSACTLRGTATLGGVHGHPPNLLNLQFEDPITLEAGVIVQKAQKPVFIKVECAHPDPWPSLGASTTYLDIYSRVSVLLKGEQNKILPGVGSEQHATQPAPQNPFPFPPLLNTPAHSIMPGKGTTLIQCTIKPCLEALKLSSLCKGPLDEAGGVGLGPAHAARKAGAKAVKHAIVNTHKPGGASLDVKATPAPTESTASIKLAGRAVEATTTKPEVLEPWAESKA